LLALFACRAFLAVVFASAFAVAVTFGLGVGLNSFAVFRLRLFAVADLLAVVNADVTYLTHFIARAPRGEGEQLNKGPVLKTLKPGFKVANDLSFGKKKAVGKRN
jgi:hypothetical protein